MFFPLILVLFLSNIVENREINDKNVNSLPKLSENSSKLLIILVDGFRWDYVEQHKDLKGFPLIAKNGVHAEYVRPIFPVNSYPNWYTISTGLYAESHGMIDNIMYEQNRKETFLMSPDPNCSHPFWWNQTEPLWTNAEKQEVKTSMYLWDGCQVNISGIVGSLCHEYRGIYDPIAADNQTRSYLNTILDDFSSNKYRLSMLYYELVDHTGHHCGPSAANTTEAIHQIDAILYDLYNDLIDRKLDQTVNVVIVSDHGMTDIKGFKNVFLNDSIDFNNIEVMLDWGSQSRIIARPNKEDEVIKQFSKIEGIKAYKKSDIPEHFHFKNNGRVLPIVVTADFGYNMLVPQILDGRLRPLPDKSGLMGNHGYDNELSDMHGIMYGFGLALKKNFTSGPIEMVDHYNLFCHILGITPHPNNGSMATMKSFLR